MARHLAQEAAETWLATSIAATRGIGWSRTATLHELTEAAQGKFHYTIGPYSDPVLHVEPGDRIRIDLNSRKVDVLLPGGELEARRAAWIRPALQNKTPWEEISRSMVGQHATGACLEPATLYLNIVEERGESRNNH